MGRKRKIKVSSLLVDYDDVDGMVHEFKETLRFHGLHVITDPRGEGVDSNGIVISDVELTESEIDFYIHGVGDPTPEWTEFYKNSDDLLNFEF